MKYLLCCMCICGFINNMIHACSCLPGYQQNQLCGLDYVVKGEVIATEQYETDTQEGYYIRVGIREQKDIFKRPKNPFILEPGSNYSSLLILTTPLSSAQCGVAGSLKLHVPYFLAGRCGGTFCSIGQCDWIMAWSNFDSEIGNHVHSYLKQWTEACSTCNVAYECDPNCPPCPVFSHQEQMCVHKCTEDQKEISAHYSEQCNLQTLSLETCAVGFNSMADDMYNKTTERSIDPALSISEAINFEVKTTEASSINTNSKIPTSITNSNIPTSIQATTHISRTLDGACVSVITPLTIGLIVAGVVVVVIVIAIAVTVVMVTKNTRETNKSNPFTTKSETYDVISEHQTTESGQINDIQTCITSGSLRQINDQEYMEPFENQYESPDVPQRHVYNNTDQYVALDVKKHVDS